MAARSQKYIEEVQNEPKDKSYWENHISEAVREFYYSEFNAESVEQIAKCSQNSFVSACEYARRSCINKPDLMTYTQHTIPTTGAVVNNEQYDSNTIEIICNVYLSLCFLYDKIPSVFGFAMLTGIDRQTLEGWVAEVKNGVTSSHRLDRQKSVRNIKAARALSLQNVAVSGGKGTVGCLAILNNETWNNPTTPEQSARPLLCSELPVLSLPGAGAPVGGSDPVELPVLGGELPVLGGND